MTSAIEKADQLRAAWKKAVEGYGAGRVSSEAEQAAWDELIEHLERSGMNHSKYDPRGSEDR